MFKETTKSWFYRVQGNHSVTVQFYDLKTFLGLIGGASGFKSLNFNTGPLLYGAKQWYNH